MLDPAALVVAVLVRVATDALVVTRLVFVRVVMVGSGCALAVPAGLEFVGGGSGCCAARGCGGCAAICCCATGSCCAGCCAMGCCAMGCCATGCAAGSCVVGAVVCVDGVAFVAVGGASAATGVAREPPESAK